MPTIGLDGVGTGADTRTSGDPHFLMDLSHTHTPAGAETITEVGFHCEGTAVGTVEVGVYRLDTNELVVSANVTSTGAGRFTTPVSAPAPGAQLGMSWRTVSASVAMHLGIASPGPDAGTRNTGLTGANALAATFTETGPALGAPRAVFATTVAAAGGPRTLTLLGVG